MRGGKLVVLKEGSPYGASWYPYEFWTDAVAVMERIKNTFKSPYPLPDKNGFQVVQCDDETWSYWVEYLPYAYEVSWREPRR